MENKFVFDNAFGDCDPADCNMTNKTPLPDEVIAPLNTDFDVYPAAPLVPDNFEFETAEEYITPPEAQEFADPPEEFGFETAKEFETGSPDNDDIAECFRKQTDLSGAYGAEQNADAESATDYSDGAHYAQNDGKCGCGDGCDDGCGCGCDYTDPSDEQAAASDELYTTTCAMAKCALDDYEIISDVLGAEKQLVKLYSTALCEAAEEPFRDIIRENLSECAADQFKTFEFMERRGMYPTEQADDETITKAKQQFTPLCRNNNAK